MVERSEIKRDLPPGILESMQFSDSAAQHVSPQSGKRNAGRSSWEPEEAQNDDLTRSKIQKYYSARNRGTKAHNSAEKEGVGDRDRYRFLKKAIGYYSEALRLIEDLPLGDIKIVETAILHSNRGLAYYNIGDAVSAIAEYNRAIETNPKFAAAYYSHGCLLTSTGEFEKSIDSYESAIRYKPGYFEAYNNLGISYANIGRHDKAVECFRTADEINPGCIGILNNIGVAYTHMDQHDKAIRYFEKINKIDASNADAYHNVGIAYTHQRDFNNAIANLKKAVDLDPDNASIHNNLGYAYEKSNEIDNAIERYRKSISIDPDKPYPYNNLGAVHGRNNDFEASIESFGKAIRIKPDFAEAFIGRGLVYMKMKNQSEALEDIAVGLFLKPALKTQLFQDEPNPIKQSLEESEAPWNSLSDSIADARKHLDGAGVSAEQQEEWAEHFDNVENVLSQLSPLRMEILRVCRAVKFLSAEEEEREVRSDFGAALNDALECLGILMSFQRIVQLIDPADGANQFQKALHRIGQALKAVEIESIGGKYLKLRAENSMISIRYLQTVISTSGRKLTREEMNER